MKLKIDLLDPNLVEIECAEIETELLPYEFEIIRIQCYQPNEKNELRLNPAETKLFYIKR